MAIRGAGSACPTVSRIIVLLQAQPKGMGNVEIYSPSLS